MAALRRNRYPTQRWDMILFVFLQPFLILVFAALWRRERSKYNANLQKRAFNKKCQTKSGSISTQPHFAKHVPHRIIFMDEGRIVEEQPPDDFFTSPKTDRAKLVLSQILDH